MEKRNFTNKTLFRIRDDRNNKIIMNQEEILQGIKIFYESLYTSSGPITRDYAEKLDIPKIPEELKAE